MDDQKKAVIDKLKGANNILVTVSSSPSVDQLAACIGLTILLNKLKKHATAVFSGTVPSTIEFLNPGDTLEQNTDSLRDFIISLDKAKADKLRYKVEENVVKIFITPYRTSISQDDLDFSQGDFNVDVVLALGVHEQQQLDDAITTHGRILHDAVVMSVNTATGADLGSVNWTDVNASSLSELAVELANGLAKDLIDGQIATSFLTGIVAETERFSNEKTSPETMKLSAELLTAGANQQLVADELGSGNSASSGSSRSSGDSRGNGGDSTPLPPPQKNDGTLEISHPQAELDEEHHHISHDDEAEEPVEPASEPEESPRQYHDESTPEMTLPEVKDVKQNTFDENSQEANQFVPPQSQLPPPHYMTEPPTFANELSADTAKEEPDEQLDMMAEHHEDIPMLDRDSKPAREQPLVWQPQVVTPTPPPPKEEPKKAKSSRSARQPQKQSQEEPAPRSQEKPASEEPAPQARKKQPESKPLAEFLKENSKPAEPAFDLPPPPAPPAPRDPAPAAAQPAAPPPPPPPPLTTPASPAPEPSQLNDQIHIDADGNIQGVDVSSAAGPAAPAPSAFTPPPAPMPAPNQPVAGAADDQRLTDIEKAVHSPHVQPAQPAATEPIEPIQEPAPSNDLDAARSAVMSAINSVPPAPAPQQGAGAEGYLKVQDLPDMSPTDGVVPPAGPPAGAPAPGVPTAAATYAPPMSSNPAQLPPPSITLPSANPVPPTTPAAGPTAPPPVPPPMTEMPPFLAPNK